MNKLDEKLKQMAMEEQSSIPEEVHLKVAQTLDCLPEKELILKKKKPAFFRLQGAICAAFIALVVLPNVSVAYGQALEKVPLVGDFVRVVTIRNYNYVDDRHELDVNVPVIEGEGLAVELINQDVGTLTDALVTQFYKDLEAYCDNGASAIYMDYEVVTNTDLWFTLKLNITETAASSYNYFKYYHIDKTTGEIVELKDLFEGDAYIDALTEEVKRQMIAEMEADENVTYWVEDQELGQDFAIVMEGQNFYFNEAGDLVLVYDEYVVGPGSMGCPEFTIAKELWERL